MGRGAHCDFHSRWLEAPSGVTWDTETWDTATYTHEDEKGADEDPPPPPPLSPLFLSSFLLLLSFFPPTYSYEEEPLLGVTASPPSYGG